MSSKVKLFRYIRPTELNLERFEIVTKPTGGIAFIFEIDQDNDILAYNFVICKDDENFNFKICKQILEGRFDKGQYDVMEYFRNLSLVDNVDTQLHYLLSRDKVLEDRAQTLKSKLKSIRNNNDLNKEAYDNIINQVSSNHLNIVDQFKVPTMMDYINSGLIAIDDDE